jgi:hypothetical protein
MALLCSVKSIVIRDVCVVVRVVAAALLLMDVKLQDMEEYVERHSVIDANTN